MNKKSEFIRRINRLGTRYPIRVAQFAYGLAIQINEESLPDDLDEAAERFMRLAAAVKSSIPAA